MIITIVADTFIQHNNGTSISAARFAAELAKRGHTVRVVTKGSPPESGYNSESGLYMFYVPELRLPVVTRLAHRQNTLIAYPKKQELQEAIAGSDVVHVYQAWPLGSSARTIAEEMGVPCIAAFHIQPENITWNAGLKWCKPAAAAVYFLMRVLFYHRFEYIHCPSVMIARQLRKHGYESRLHVISNGIHPDFHPLEDAGKFDDGKFHILTVGRVSPEKRQDLLIKAAELSRYSDKIQLHIAGKGPLLDKLKEMAENLKNKPLFSHHSQESLIALMRRAHLYVHASDIEIEGMGCTEAFSCGLVPVISNSGLSATGQFALDERSLFQAGNAQSLSKKIDYWYENRDELKKASAAYAAAGKAYALSKCVAEMEQVYSRAVSRARRGEAVTVAE